MHNYPSIFPPLPEHADGPWPVHIVTAHNLTNDIYVHALRVLDENSDPSRAAFHIDAITSDAIPVLSAIEEEKKNRNIKISDDWLFENAKLLGNLVVSLRAAIALQDNR